MRERGKEIEKEEKRERKMKKERKKNRSELNYNGPPINCMSIMRGVREREREGK
jgi:hypothetical protein